MMVATGIFQSIYQNLQACWDAVIFFLHFAYQRLPELWVRTGQHLFLVGVATGAATLIGIPLGTLCSRSKRLRGPTLGVISIMQTIPSLAMLAILLALTDKIGALPAIIALTLYALLPIVRNTLTGLEGVPDRLIEAARGVGMTKRQRLLMVEFPLAAPVIVAGIRTAAVISVGIATLSAFIGAGGLGQFINSGLSLDNTPLIILGAVPAAILALLVDFTIFSAEWGLKPQRQGRHSRRVTHMKQLALLMPVLLIAFGVLTSLTHLTPHGLTLGDGQRVAVSDGGSVRIGSKEFGEQLILGEMMAQMIEDRTDLNVERTFGLGGTMICHNALKKGEIDLYPEYTGTGYRAVLDRNRPLGPYRIFQNVADAYRKKFALTWLEPFGFNNTYAITVRRRDAVKNGWKTISDLGASAGRLRAGFTSEFKERQDGYPGMAAAYGFRFGRTQDLSPALMCKALANGEVDVICAFATDGRLAAYDLVLLKDDRGFFPPYDAAPVVRRETLEKHPEIRQALAPLGGLLDDATMQRLNYQVESHKRSPADVAHEFLKQRGLIR